MQLPFVPAPCALAPAPRGHAQGRGAVHLLVRHDVDQALLAGARAHHREHVHQRRLREQHAACASRVSDAARSKRSWFPFRTSTRVQSAGLRCSPQTAEWGPCSSGAGSRSWAAGGPPGASTPPAPARPGAHNRDTMNLNLRIKKRNAHHKGKRGSQRWCGCLCHNLMIKVLLLFSFKENNQKREVNCKCPFWSLLLAMTDVQGPC
jgi:hypothetical protein